MPTNKFHKYHGTSPEFRLMDRVKKTPTCWLWQGQINSWGYGQLMVEGKYLAAHRLSWTLKRGDIPEGKSVLHTCDVRNCVNPEHLYLGSHEENMADRKRRGRYKPDPTAKNPRRKGQSALHIK